MIREYTQGKASAKRINASGKSYWRCVCLLFVFAFALCALTGCGKAKKLAEEGIELFESGQYDEAVDTLAEAIENKGWSDTVSERDLNLYYARALFGASQYEKAIEVWEELIEEDDEDGTLYHNIGLAYMGLEEYEDAVESFVTAAENGNAASYEYAGKAAFMAESYEDALGYFEQALEVEEKAGIYLQMGKCEVQLENYEEALADFEQGIELSDSDVMQSLLYQQAVCYEYLEDYETALTMMEAYVEAYPDDELAQKEYEFLQTR